MNSKKPRIAISLRIVKSTTYDETRDAFFRPQPFNSWTLNESTCLWESPVPYPADGGRYLWNEEKIKTDLR